MTALIIDFAAYREERRVAALRAAIARQLLDDGVIAVNLPEIDWCLPCDTEGYKIEITTSDHETI